jgi:death on curing protein
MIGKEAILQLHELSIKTYGGSHGLRDEGLLESAIGRAYQTFGGEDLYPTAIEKAAAIFESLVINHPFVDGNKRTGFLGMYAVLQMGGIDLTAAQADAYTFTIAVSTGEKKYDDIVAWLKNNTATL